MEQAIQFLREFNAQNIISMALIMWFFSRQIWIKIDKVETDLKESIRIEREKLDRHSLEFTKRSDRLYEMFYELVKSHKSAN